MKKLGNGFYVPELAVEEHEKIWEEANKKVKDESLPLHEEMKIAKCLIEESIKAEVGRYENDLSYLDNLQLSPNFPIKSLVIMYDDILRKIPVFLEHIKKVAEIFIPSPNNEDVIKQAEEKLKIIFDKIQSSKEGKIQSVNFE